MEQELRKKAIDRYLSGEKPVQIYTDLDRSKFWFFKWLKRYNSGDPKWYLSKSKIPIRQPTKTSRQVRKEILLIKDRLSTQGLKRIGSKSIKDVFLKNEQIAPSDSTIYRVLSRATFKEKTTRLPISSEYDYFTEALDINNIHQANFIGPLYLKGDGKFYSYIVTDLYSKFVFIESQRTITERQIASSLLRSWKLMGPPDFLLLDNETAFPYTYMSARSPGLSIKLCLYCGVQPVILPNGEGWRNSAVNHFIETYNRQFFRRHWFQSYYQLKRQSKNFQNYHNSNHRYKDLNNSTPREMVEMSELKPVKVTSHIKLVDLNYIPDGNVIILRVIDNNRELDVFGEKFKAPKDLIGKYVKAIIVTDIRTLQIYLGDKIVARYEYPLLSDELPKFGKN